MIGLHFYSSFTIQTTVFLLLLEEWFFNLPCGMQMLRHFVKIYDAMKKMGSHISQKC